jgi:hypothetical protein
MMPEHKIVTHAAARRVLRRSELHALSVAGKIPNPINPAFRPVSVYYVKDVANVLVNAGREIPDDFL